jgi:hypothetical protein
MAKKQSPSTLLWFIRRKAYVPLCEIRRRFDIDGEEGSFFDGDHGARVFVGLPANSSAAIEKLWRQGKIGLEFSVEFDCRVLIGVYPMSPVREQHLDPPRPIRSPAVALQEEEIFEMEAPKAMAAGE